MPGSPWSEANSRASSSSASGDFKKNLHRVCQNSFHPMEKMIPLAAKDRPSRERRKKAL